MSNIEEIIDDVMNGKTSSAEKKFADAMSLRIGDALDAKRVEVGQSMSLDPTEPSVENNDTDEEV